MQNVLFQRPEFLCGPSKPVIQNVGSAPIFELTTDHRRSNFVSDVCKSLCLYFLSSVYSNYCSCVFFSFLTKLRTTNPVCF